MTTQTEAMTTGDVTNRLFNDYPGMPVAVKVEGKFYNTGNADGFINQDMPDTVLNAESFTVRTDNGVHVAAKLNQHNPNGRLQIYVQTEADEMGAYYEVASLTVETIGQYEVVAINAGDVICC